MLELEWMEEIPGACCTMMRTRRKGGVVGLRVLAGFPFLEEKGTVLEYL
jgi:hypothetical protein